MTHAHDHDNGLHFDLGTIFARRQFLNLAALASTSAIVAACDSGPSQSEANKTATAADGTVCIKDPQETNGPYPADGSNSANGKLANALTTSGVKRADIRECFGGVAGKAEGIETSLTISIVNVGKACEPLAGRVIYIWHCDRDGKYSMYDLPELNYLRGVGVTDAQGKVTFTTIFPGCYAGRWPHIHFEVFDSEAKAAAGTDSILVSQFALPKEACDAAYAEASYTGSAANLLKSPLASGMVFSDNTAEQSAAMMLKVSGDPAKGYAANVTVGVVVA